jgi:integrase
MARGIGRLSGADLRRSKPGLRCDGGGLWLQITDAKGGGTSRSWIFRFTLAGRTRSMGLGSLLTIGLKDARERARRCRELLLDGIDPIAQRDTERAAKAAASIKSMTFEQAAVAYISAHRSRWRNQQHALEWPTSLRAHVFPTLGKIDVREIDTALVVRALERVWKEAPETGSRLRGRIEFMARLREISGTPARAFEFLILCAARAGEVRGATWGEIDFDEAIWCIPGQRMKAGREHRVPLSARCIEILREMSALRTNDFLFAGRDGKLGESAFHHLLRKLDRRDVTAHGFRSAFRDWCGESTNFPREIAEAALAHVSGDATERAYRRGDALQKRQQLMEAWATFCGRPTPAGATVTPLRAHAGA